MRRQKAQETCDALDYAIDFGPSAKISGGAVWSTLLLAAWKGWLDIEAVWGQEDTVCSGKGHISSFLAANNSSGPPKRYHFDFMACSSLEGPGSKLGSLWRCRSHQRAFFGFYTIWQPGCPCCTSLPEQDCAWHQEDPSGSSPLESKLVFSWCPVAGVEQRALVLPQCRPVYHNLCMYMLPSPLFLGQIYSAILQCAMLISETLHVTSQLMKHSSEVWKFFSKGEKRTFKCPQTIQALDHVAGAAIPQINLFVWIPQGAASRLLPLRRWGWWACAGQKGPQKYLSGLLSVERNLSKVPSQKAFTLPVKQGLLRKEMHANYMGKGGASAHKLNFLGASPSPLSQI